MYSAALQFDTPQKPVSPRNCGLAIAVPLGQKGFFAKLGSEAEGNFVQTFGGERQNLSPEGLWGLYEPYARYAQEVAVRAQRAGVSVVIDSTLKDFVGLLTTCGVVTLVAHWKSALFKPADITDPAATLSQLSQQDSLLSLALRRFSDHPVRLPPAADAASIAQVLNQVLLGGLAVPGPSEGGTRLGVITRFHSEIYRRRQAVASAGTFPGGPSVEFQEGFYRLQDVVDNVPSEFSGLLDLTVCNSVMLAESIRRVRPHCLVLANEDLAFLDFRMAVYAQVLQSLVRRTEPYEDAVYRIRKELKEVGDEWVKRGASPLHRFRSAFWRRGWGNRLPGPLQQ